jgi:hypothetical protein
VAAIITLGAVSSISEPQAGADRFAGIGRARSLSAVSEAPPSEELGVETLWTGASDTAARRKPPLGDYGICFSRRRSLSFAVWVLLSVRFRFGCWWQREWS